MFLNLYKGLLFSSVCLMLCLFVACSENNHSIQQRQPTEGTIIKWDMEEGGKTEARTKWFEAVHKSAPEDNWKIIELQNQLAHVKKFKNQLHNNNRGDEIEVIGDDLLSGIWHEKGAHNQAGSVNATVYDTENDMLYTIAAGGAIFKRKKGADNWEVVNQNMVFASGILEIFTFQGQKRMIASSADIPVISDDMGITWRPATGLEAHSSWATFFNCVIVGNEDPSIFALFKDDYWSPFFVVRSLDGGATWQSIRALGNNESNKFWLTSAQHSDGLFLFDNVDEERTDVYSFDESMEMFWPIVSTTELSFGSDYPTNSQAILKDSSLTFYSYADSEFVYVSYDSCQSWVQKGQIPSKPWNRRFYVFPSSPNRMLAGGVELFYSEDEGNSWTKHAEWWEYYDNIPEKLHADMMYFKEFQDTISGEYFSIVANHGGMSLTSDFGKSFQNIGMAGLNVCQYYSVRTDPIDRTIMYAGTQDQGFARGIDSGDDKPNDFEQVISGDYGHIVFSQNGERLWTVYPGGDVSYYHDPHTGGVTRWFDIEGDDESVWIPPMVESPNKEKNEIFVAGGEKDGGAGSYLMRLEYLGGSIFADQFDFDFKEASDGEITAIAFAPADPNIIFVGTSSGSFFTSKDAGLTWTQSDFEGPSPQYLYGNAIVASAIDTGTVYYGGSGYSNSPVYKSTDFGHTFSEMDAGLPPTLVTGLVMNKEETLVFASTENGPYVLDVLEETWYPMAGAKAPSTRYWSVEYLADLNRVRFGTYGRGIWDFEIEQTISSNKNLIADNDWNFYPNPVSDQIYIELSVDFPKNTKLNVFSIDGKLLKSAYVQDSKYSFDVSNLLSGQYLLNLITQDGKTGSKIFIKQ